MKYPSRIICLVCLAAWIGVPLAVFAQIVPPCFHLPDLDLSHAVVLSAMPVSVYCLPDGSGDRLDNCYLFGGSRVNATIEVTLLDCNGDPHQGLDRDYIWLDTEDGNFDFCANGTIADHATDAQGQTTFTGALRTGGSCFQAAGTPVIVIVCGHDIGSHLPMYFNSPDLNGDLVVDLTDVVLFASDYFDTYNYRSDFLWDGTLNLSDVALLANGLVSSCQ